MAYNPFRVSFDRPFPKRERTRARVAATLIGGTVVLLGATGGLALLNASSDTLGAWSNGRSDARMAARDQAVKPCKDQTWPNIEPRCLERADPKSAAPATAKQAPTANRGVVGSVGAPSVKKPATESSPAGIGTRLATTEEDPAAAPKPALPQAVGADSRKRAATQPRPLVRDQRQAQREERLRREARRARAEAREEARRMRGQRFDREWSEEIDNRSFGGGRWAIVPPQGSFDSRFLPFR